MKYCTNCGNELKENSNFCTNCGKPTKKELEKIKKIEKEKKEQANEKLLLWLGTFLVIISSTIFAFTNWENMNDIFKVVFLSIEALIFFASSFAFKKLKNDGAHKTMWFLGTIFIIVILNFIGEKELLGNYLSYKGSGIYVYLALSSALCALIYYLSSKFMKSKTFLFFGHVFLYLMVISLLYLFKMDKIYSESLILPVLCLFNLIIIIINIFVKNKQTGTFMSIISLIFVPITLTYSVIYSDSVINSIIPFVFELISLFIIIKTEKNNPLNYIFVILIYVLTLGLVPDTIDLFTSSISIELFITILSLALLYFILTIISDKSISVMSYILTMILSYLNIFCYSIRPEVAIIMTLIIGVIQIFTIKFNDEKIKKTISELLLPITMFILIYNIFEVFIDAKLELILLVASILCFLINTFINKNEKETVINSIFEAFAFIFLSVSSIVIIFNGNSLTAFLLNELLWIYYFIYVLINKNIKSENIVMLILTICNLFLCSIRLNIKLYYVLLFVTGIIALIYMFSDKIKITFKSVLKYILFSMLIILTLFDIKNYSMYAVIANVLIYSLVFYMYNKEGKLRFIFKYIYTLLGFILIYKLFNCYIEKIVIANIFTLVSYIIIIISMYLLEIDTDRKITCYTPVIILPYINLVQNVDIFESIQTELILSILIIFTFIICDYVIKLSKKSDKEVLELTILAMIFIYSLTEALTFSLIISIVTLIYGLVKKSNPLIVFGIISFVISMIVNLFRIFDNLALVFIILGFGIALISYVFYKETKKNKN